MGDRAAGALLEGRGGHHLCRSEAAAIRAPVDDEIAARFAGPSVIDALGRERDA